MDLNKFDIGDAISAVFTYNTNQFSYSNHYLFIEIDNRFYIKIGNDLIELTVNDNDSSSREFMRMFRLLEHPIVKINRHIKSQKKLYLIIFNYNEYLKFDEVFMYYSNDFFREVNYKTNIPLQPFIENEFIINNHLLYQPNISNKVVNIIGDSYSMTAQQIEENVFRLESIIRKPRKPTYGITDLYFEKIKIQKQDDFLKEKQKKSGIIDKQSPEVKYVKFWQEYLKVEKNQAIIDLYEAGSFKYDSYVIQGENIVFNINKGSQHSFNLSEGISVSVYSKQISDLIYYLYNGAKYAVDMNSLNHAHELELVDDGEIVVGNVKECNSNSLTIGIEEKNMSNLSGLPKKGFIGISFMGFRVNYERKRNILKNLRDKGSHFLKNIVLYGSLLIMDQDQLKFSKNTVKTDTIIAMFGRDDIVPTDNQKEAIRLALTSPDIALIQGPPGTGKTTIIKGLISRIKSLHSYPPRILIATEQHEALHNVIDDVNTEIPPTVISFRQSDDERTKLFAVTAYQDKLIKLFQDYLAKHDHKEEKNIIFDFIVTAVSKNYNKDYILENINQIANVIKRYDNDDLLKDLKAIELFFIRRESHHDFRDELLNEFLSSQRTEAESYCDDGREKLIDLINYLKLDYPEELENFQLIFDGLENNQNVYIKYRNLVDALSVKNRVPDDFSNSTSGIKDLFDRFTQDFENYITSLTYSSVENVVNRFLDDIRNPYILKNTIQYYNSIFGSTCQQSAKFKKMDISATSKFDYVIIDEASRVNPVDLLIPMTMGHKIILVGDQKQLPHYLERGNVKVLAEKVKSKNEVLYEVLKESLFERIFNLLEKESKFKRTITLLEQYRMNPILGKFISDNFYDGIIKNGVGVEKKVNNYGICDNKSVAWIDIDKSFGTEVRNHSGSLYRNAEVIAILDSLSKLSKNFYDDLSKFPMVGVISYYKAQTEIIKERIISKFPSHIIDKITVGTVDSFQGKEFDVVYLSTVRANANSDIRERIGFLSDNPNRINVSMSRAKNLMVIVGDSDTLAKNSKSIINKYFNNFLEVCEAEGYYAQKEV